MGTIRPMSPLDVIRWKLQSNRDTSNRVCALSGLGGQATTTPSLIAASKAALSPSRRRLTWVLCEGVQVVSVATTQRRSGPRSWEVTHLFVPTEMHDQLPELLEKLSQTAAAHGGERVFIRLPQEDTVVDVARHCGFFPSVTEVLYKRDLGRNMRLPTDPTESPSGLREKRLEDEHDLFRLYNAATPTSTRQAFGMTFGQWQASCEQLPGRCDEYVLEEDGAIKGWVRTVRRSGTGHLAATVHPDNEGRLSDLVEMGLRRLRRADSAYAMVPEYEPHLQRVLEFQGFIPVGQYVTSVKSTAVKVEEKARATAAIPTG